MILLGVLQYKGNNIRGVGCHPPDKQTAEKLFDKACQNDQIQVPYLVGKFYERVMDYPKAVKFYTIAGENGHLDAQIWLGNYYNGGIRNYEVFDQHKALSWFEKSAAQGHASSVKKVKQLNDIGVYSNQKLKDKVGNKCR